MGLWENCWFALIIKCSFLRTSFQPLGVLGHCGRGGAAAVRIFPPSCPLARKILVRVDWR